MSNAITDERLSAYLDGAIDAAGANEIERALRESEALALRLETFRRGDHLLCTAVDEALGDVPDGLIRVVSVRPISRRTWRRSEVVRYAAMAASLLIVFAAGIFLGRSPKVGNAPMILAGKSGLVLGPRLAGIMRASYSGVPIETAFGQVSVNLSFATHQGALCRVFQIAGPNLDQRSVGVACLEDQHWVVEGWTQDKLQVRKTGYVTASGPSNQVIDGLIDRLELRKVFSRDDETKAIKSEWRARP